MNWADYLIIIVIALSVLMGLWRGLLREVISLVAWIAAFTIAFLFAEPASAQLIGHINTPSLRIAAAFAGLFLVTLLLGSLVGVVASQLIDRAGLTWADRILGMGFGFGRGALIIATLVLVAGLTPLPQDPWWRQSMLLPHFQGTALWLRGLLPPEIAQNFRY